MRALRVVASISGVASWSVPVVVGGVEGGSGSVGKRRKMRKY